MHERDNYEKAGINDHINIPYEQLIALTTYMERFTKIHNSNTTWHWWMYMKGSSANFYKEVVNE